MPESRGARLSGRAVSIRLAAAERRLPRPPERSADYVVAAARRIHEVLGRTGRDVPFYVFGHTHLPGDRPIDAGADRPRYLNPGAWSPALRPGNDLPDRYRLLALEQNADRTVARGLLWNDQRRALEG